MNTKASAVLFQVGEAFHNAFRYLHSMGAGIAMVSLPNGNSARVRLLPNGHRQVFYQGSWVYYDPMFFPAEAMKG